MRIRSAALLFLIPLAGFLLNCSRPVHRPARVPTSVVPGPKPSAARRPLVALGYTLQVGAFAKVENAFKLTETLQKQGLEATYYLSPQQLYRVRFGDFPTREAARKRAEALRDAGVIQEFYIVPPEAALPSAQRPEADVLRNHLAETARSYVGVPYLWGGTSEKGFDCSGLAQAVFRLNGLRLPRSSREQFDAGTPVPMGDLRKGDLVFFDINASGQISHVGVYIGDGMFIHAPGRGRGICAERLSQTYFQQRWAGARTYL
ncbi:MAG TPA: NlpC/P60 family protein [Holophaga sp.]|jgi:hypothetical protein|nr:NlpC/P60 family protein [Holophaga sp.]